AQLHEKGQPVLVGTISIEKSERLAGFLKRQGVKHNVLNAKFHEKEAEIIAQAGQKGTVTIATNMAGRGTDILLGGNPDFLYKRFLYQEGNEALPEEQKKAMLEQIAKTCEEDRRDVIAAGGVHILGTERHESRRIDNQLRGRSGRQGDPGSSRFYLSLEDDLMRIFASERVSQMMLKLGMEEGVPIEHGMVTRAIANAQKKVEAHNFDIRKQLLEYDDVMNKQREVIYKHRRAILTGDDLSEQVRHMMSQDVDSLLDIHCPGEQYPEEWNFQGLIESLHAQFGLTFIHNGSGPGTAEELKDLGREALKQELHERVQKAYAQKEQEMGSELLRQLEKMVMLQVIDYHWKDHLLSMDHLRDGIGLRGYGQKDPLIEYKREGYDMFAAMMSRIKGDVLDRLFHIQAVRGEEPPPVALRPAVQPRLSFNRGEDTAQPQAPVHRTSDKVGRNDPCPCGSGTKSPKCHGVCALGLRLAPGTRAKEKGSLVGSLCSRNARWREVSLRFGLLPCAQNAHTQTVLVRCAQSEETKPHSKGRV
ncbi:MAG: SEC-C domain-containing protein, partial [Nitrospirae bacterium]|nr:SEC-C domain-containing protein [Nitrospirota bacterium]